MSFLNTLGSSRFLKKEDVGAGMVFTVKGAAKEDVSQEDEPEKIKVVLYFEESEKGLVLGVTVGNQIASFLGDPGESPRAWYGKKIELYNDTNVTMKGKIVGGIRARQPRGGQPPQQQPQPQAQQPNQAWDAPKPKSQPQPQDEPDWL